MTAKVPNARITLFGFEPEPAELEVLPRSRGWRARRALAALGVTAVGAPLAFAIPPHAPWGVGALAAGCAVAYRRWSETHTVERMQGRCPSCGAPLALPAGVRLHSPHKLHCEGCNHEPLLVADPPPAP